MKAGKMERTNYPGVSQRIAGIAPDGKPEITYFIRYRTKDGKQIFEKTGRRSAGETAKKANDRRSARMRGKEPTNTERREFERAEKARPSFDCLWEEYKNRRPDLKGLRYDENRFTLHISPAIGSKLPEELTPSDIDALQARVTKKHSPGTVKNVLELVRRLINFGVDKHLCAGASFRIRLPKVNNERMETMNAEEMARYLEELDKVADDQGRNLLKLALFSGMRKGELLNLKWRDVDLDRRFLTIRNPKGGRDVSIPLNDLALDVLRQHPRTGSEYVFPGRDGGKRSDFKRIANRVKEKAGLPKDFRPLHGLRHNFASALASSGEVDMYTLQRLMTHKSPLMTQRYAHLRDETLRRASNVFTNALAEKPEEK